MRASDVFVFLDDVQIPQGRSYVYRCQIRDGDTARWLYIPMLRSLEDAITAVRFADARWAKKHLTTLRQHYARAPFHEEILTLVEPVYSDPGELLAELS